MTYKSSNCCDAYVNPDLMVCADCKEPCSIIIDDEEIYTLPKNKINWTPLIILVAGIVTGLFISAVFIHLTLFN